MSAFDMPSSVSGAASIEIAKPVDKVFKEVAVDFFKKYPLWALEVDEFQPLEGYAVAVGKKARQIRTDQGQTVESIFEVIEFDPPEKLTIQGIDVAYRNSYLFERIDEKNTLLTYKFELLDLDFFIRPFQKLIRVAIEEGAENTVNNIKSIIMNPRKRKIVSSRADVPTG
ncbi:MAG: hypothetical protein ACU833_08710 [Gammaproteobacteria bacterium]